jgi:hypothetical protein
VPSKKDVTDVVIALHAQRLADRGIVDIMDAIASKKLSVLAVCATAAARTADSRTPEPVHRAKTGSGKGNKQLWVIDHRRRHTVMPTVEASVNQLPNVPGVQV